MVDPEMIALLRALIGKFPDGAAELDAAIRSDAMPERPEPACKDPACKDPARQDPARQDPARQDPAHQDGASVDDFTQAGPMAPRRAPTMWR